MRLTLGLLAAIGLHGAIVGVAAALLSRAPAKTDAPLAIAVDVIPPTPAPVADSALGPTSRTPGPTLSPRPHAPRNVREVALVHNSTPISALAVSPARAQVMDPAATPQGGGAVLSAQPRYHSNRRPAYPLPSLRRREEGTVLLNVQVQADGTPAAVSVNTSCGHPLLDRAALDAVRRWTFEPARA